MPPDGIWPPAIQGRQRGTQRAGRRGGAEEDLAPYMGKWVALRSGTVVANDLSAKALRGHDEVRPTDAIVPVPRTRAGYFIA